MSNNKAKEKKNNILCYLQACSDRMVSLHKLNQYQSCKKLCTITIPCIHNSAYFTVLVVLLRTYSNIHKM